MYINLLIITAIIVWGIDVLGFIENFKEKIWRWAKNGKEYKYFSFKPFDCSLCTSWWVGLFILLIYNELTIPNIGYVALLSSLTPVIREFIFLLNDFFFKILKIIAKILNL